MSKILVVPDVHGRDFWKEPCQKWQGSIVFLGDYHDPYPGQVSKKQSLANLEELVEFYKEYNQDNRIVCLLGNHDANYLIRWGFANRGDSGNYNQVRDLILELEPKLIYQVDDILFSHSGVLPEWLNYNNLKLEDLHTSSFDNPALEDVSPYRGGYGCEVGSVLWGDVREYHMSEHIPNIYQIFGHTQLEKDPIIKEDYAELDARKCYVVDTETKTIQEYVEVCGSSSDVC